MPARTPQNLKRPILNARHQAQDNQIPLVGRCDLRTYGWYVRVPRFAPFFGRTLLVEPVVIQANCAETPGLAPVTAPAE